jgi:hypoxanthine phosphoribosyltransferase
VLPALRQAAGTGASPNFAHPAEVDLSRLLSYYGVRWVYEPTTFALAWDPDGRPSECFTPDFYLPEQRLYIELTTMRQRLVTRKNRKLRRLRALYPNVQVKLLYRRDYLRLVDAYPVPTHPPGECRLGPVFLSDAAIQVRVRELADSISVDLGGSGLPAEASPTPLVLALGSGSRPFFGDLVRGLRERGAAFEVDRAELSRYRILGGMRRVRVRRAPAVAVAGRRVVVVADLVSTGLSLAYLSRWLRRRGAAEVEICTLLDRPAARLIDVAVRYRGFEAPAEILVGYGLPLHRQFRSLPYVARLAPE